MEDGQREGRPVNADTRASHPGRDDEVTKGWWEGCPLRPSNRRRLTIDLYTVNEQRGRGRGRGRVTPTAHTHTHTHQTPRQLWEYPRTLTLRRLTGIAGLIHSPLLPLPPATPPNWSNSWRGHSQPPLPPSSNAPGATAAPSPARRPTATATATATATEYMGVQHQTTLVPMAS